MRRTLAPLSVAFVGLTLFDGARAQESAALFDAALVAFDDLTSIRFLADVNGDGTKEALGTWWKDINKNSLWVTAYRRDGSGTYSQLWRVATPDIGSLSIEPPAMDVGDLNSDGTTDFVLGLWNQVTVHRCVPSGPPSPGASWVEPAIVYHLVVADFTGDGRLDVATQSNRLRIWRNDGVNFSMTGDLGFPMAPGHVQAFQRTDINGDAVPDLLMANGTTLLLYSVTNGVPVLAQTLQHATNHPMPATGDIDGDGDEDIVVFGMDPNEYRVLRRTGQTAFTVEPLVAGGPATGLADVDGDGDLDGVCCGGGGGVPNGPNARASQFEISINRGSGAFALAYGIKGLGAYHLAAATDLDSDGDVDLISGRAIYYARQPLGHDPLFRLPVAVTDRVIVDVDRDGDPDAHPGIASVVSNRGDGWFGTAAPVIAPAPGGTRFEGPGFLGDFDGDGDADLIVSYYQGQVFLSMRLLKNTGGGGFVDGGAASSAGVDFNSKGVSRRNDPVYGIAADADGDGDLDLIVNQAPGAVAPFGARAWWNDGTGAFAAGPLFSTGSVERVADLDLDGRPDAVLAGAFGLEATRGLGGGAFAAPASFRWVIARSNVDRFEVMDWDGDSDLDILGGIDTTGSGGGPRLGLVINQGGFNFTRGVGPGMDRLKEPRVAWQADVNADGLADFLYHPAGTGGTSIQLRQSNGSLGPAFLQAFAPTAMTDVDGDGDLDAFDGAILQRNEKYAGSAGGLRVQYGVGTAGTGGLVPKLGATGPFRAGYTAEKCMNGAVGGSLAILVFGPVGGDLRDVPLPGMALYVLAPLVAVPVPLSGRSGEPGAGEFRIPFWIPPSLTGVLVHDQAFIVDLGAPGTLAATNGLALVFGK